MKKLIVVANDLEGSGKSTFARSFQHLLTNQDVKHLFITTDEQDMDDSFCGDYWDFDEDLDISQLILAIDRNDVVLLDLRSGSARLWYEFFAQNEVDTLLAEIDATMTLVIPCHDSERCHEELVELAELFSDSTDYVIPHFPMPAERSKKQAWKGSYAAKVTDYLGALHFEMPELGKELATALESHDLTLSQALTQLDELPRFVEVAVMQWLEEISKAINGTGEYVLPHQPTKLKKFLNKFQGTGKTVTA